jgi:hypothetical protein
MTCRNIFNRRRNRDPDVYPASKGWAIPADGPTGVRHEGGVTSVPTYSMQHIETTYYIVALRHPVNMTG